MLAEPDEILAISDLSRFRYETEIGNRSMLSFSPLIAITKSLAWSNGRPTMLENCSLVNRVTSVSPEPTESMTFVPVWTRLAVRDTEGRHAASSSASPASSMPLRMTSEKQSCARCTTLLVLIR